MDPDGLDNTPTNLSKPATAATLTIRVVKSFTYRTERSLVLHDLNLETVTCGELKELVRGGTASPAFTAPPPGNDDLSSTSSGALSMQ